MKIFLTFFLVFTFFKLLASTDTLSVYFDFDQSNIKTSEKVKLDGFIHQSDSIEQIKIYGYTDFKGTVKYNNKLSIERANRVKDYLILNGFNNDSIGLCEGKGILDGQTKNEDLRALNRKVDIIYSILSKQKQDSISPDSSTSSLIDVRKIKVGDKLVLKRMYFQGGRHYLHPKSVNLLKDLLNMMENNPELKIEIQGHICCQKSGEGIDNDTGERNLSEARAKYIYDYLIENKIDSSRLSYKGFGSSQLLPGTSYFDTRNRRVELLILDK